MAAIYEILFKTICNKSEHLKNIIFYMTHISSKITHTKHLKCIVIKRFIITTRTRQLRKISHRSVTLLHKTVPKYIRHITFISTSV